jgi:hypothetical protein
MTNENLRMQMLAGVITEGEYTAIINQEIEDTEKDSLNESMIGGIVGIGAINQIPPTPKTDYEMAFEHFLGERYESNTEGEDIKGIEDMFGGEMSPADRYIVFGDEEGADGMDDEVSMNEGESKFFVYTDHTPEGKWIGKAKILVRNLTMDDAKIFIEKNQSEYKFPLAWSEDRSDYDFSSAEDEDIFPIS